MWFFFTSSDCFIVFADKVFYYYDIPAGFTRRDHMDRLFDTDEDRFSAKEYVTILALFYTYVHM